MAVCLHGQKCQSEKATAALHAELEATKVAAQEERDEADNKLRKLKGTIEALEKETASVRAELRGYMLAEEGAAADE